MKIKKIHALIIKLVKLFKEKDWNIREQNYNINKKNPMKILSIRLYIKANIFD